MFSVPRKLVHDQSSQSLAFDVFGDNQHWLAHLGDLLEQSAASPSLS